MKALLVGIAVLSIGAASVFAQEGQHVGRKSEAGGYGQCGSNPCDPAALAQDMRVKTALGMGPHVMHHRHSCKYGSGRRCTVRALGS
jgi:hypothetical protein